MDLAARLGPLCERTMFGQKIVFMSGADLVGRTGSGCG